MAQSFILILCTFIGLSLEVQLTSGHRWISQDPISSLDPVYLSSLALEIVNDMGSLI